MTAYVGPSESHSRALYERPKTRHNREANAAKASPFREVHERSRQAPRLLSIGDYKRELRDAVEAETPSALQSNTAIEQEDKGVLHVDGEVRFVEGGGSGLGTPRWTVGFRSYITGSAFAMNCGHRDGERHDRECGFRFPVRASIAAMEADPVSATTRRAGELIYLMVRNGFNHVAAWREQLGRFVAALDDTWTRELVIGTADAQAAEALRRWWDVFERTPRAVTVGPAPEIVCNFPTPDCPHGHGAVLR